MCLQLNRELLQNVCIIPTQNNTKKQNKTTSVVNDPHGHGFFQQFQALKFSLP